MNRKTRGAAAGTPATAPVETKQEAPVVETTQEPVASESAAPAAEPTPEATEVAQEAPAAESKDIPTESAPAAEAPSAPLSEAEIQAASEAAVAAESAMVAVVESAVATPHADASPIVAALLNTFDQYLVEMDSGVQPAVDNGIALQRRLYRTLVSILTLGEGKDFITAMNYVIGRIRETRGPRRAFNENWVFRFYEHNPLPARDKMAAELLIMFLIGVADGYSQAELRASAKMLTTKRVLADEFVSRLTAYASRMTK